MNASGPVQAICAPVTRQQTSPIPVIPRTLRATARMPPARWTPDCGLSATAAPRANDPMAAPPSARTKPVRRTGSRQPVARSGSPNGLYVVTAMIPAAPPWRIIGSSSAALRVPSPQW